MVVNRWRLVELRKGYAFRRYSSTSEEEDRLGSVNRLPSSYVQPAITEMFL